MRPDRRSHEFTCESCLRCTVCNLALADALAVDGDCHPCIRNGAHHHPTPQDLEAPYVPEWAIPLALQRRTAWR